MLLNTHIEKFRTRIRTSRRSRFIALALSVAVPLAACSSHDEDAVTTPEQIHTYLLNTYQSAEQCVDAHVFTSEFCRKADREARLSHAEKAPRYEGKKDCEQDWGDCEEVLGNFDPRGVDSSSSSPSRSHGGGYVAPRTYYSPPYRGYSLASDYAGQDFKTSPIMRTAQNNFASLNGLQGLQPGVQQTANLTSHPQEPQAPSSYHAGESATARGAAPGKAGEAGAHGTSPGRPVGSSARGGMGMHGPAFGGGG